MLVTLGTFLKLENEAEHVLSATRDEDVRDIIAILRGQLELARDWNAPIDIDEIERALTRIAERIGTDNWRHDFLARLHCVAGWARAVPFKSESLTGILQDSSGHGVTRNDTQPAAPLP